MQIKKLSPPLQIVIIFLGAIITGTILLLIPISRRVPISLIDALFTETSAVCVTGLIVKSTADDFTIIGQIIILISIQLGGLGIMTISTFFFQLLKKELSMRDHLVIKELVGTEDFSDIRRLIRNVVRYTMIFESFGAFFFALKFVPEYGWIKGLWHSIFHSVSSFCNAGFSTFNESFARFSGSPMVLVTSALLIVFGGLGFLVLHEIFHIDLFTKKFKISLKKLSLQSQFAVLGTLFFILIGFLAFYLLERENTLAHMNGKEKVLTSVYHSITARTAGFNVVDMSEVKTSTLILTEALMFVGACPGSTGGGIKITTFMILVFILSAFIRQKSSVITNRKTIPQLTLYKAMTIFLFSITLIFFAFMLLMHFNPILLWNKHQDGSLRILFEIISAFGTVGLSAGVTGELNFIGKSIIIIMMFLGRLSPTLISLSIKKGDVQSQVIYPEERVLIG